MDQDIQYIVTHAGVCKPCRSCYSMFLLLLEQCSHAVGIQLQGAFAHGDPRGKEETRLSGGSSESAAAPGAGAHGQLGGTERH